MHYLLANIRVFNPRRIPIIAGHPNPCAYIYILNEANKVFEDRKLCSHRWTYLYRHTCICIKIVYRGECMIKLSTKSFSQKRAHPLVNETSPNTKLCQERTWVPDRLRHAQVLSALQNVCCLHKGVKKWLLRMDTCSVKLAKQQVRYCIANSISKKMFCRRLFGLKRNPSYQLSVGY